MYSWLRKKWQSPGRFYRTRIWLTFGGWRDVWTLMITLVVLFTLVNINNESANRRDQNCKIFEGQERDARRGLALTYRYLSSLRPDQIVGPTADPINKLLLAQLPETELTARSTVAPAYCNEPGVGLPEPGVPFPSRPAGLPGPPAP